MRSLVSGGWYPQRSEHQAALEYKATHPRLARELYDIAQWLTDEKLRRDKADSDEGKAD